jgi:hypothetical protein
MSVLFQKIRGNIFPGDRLRSQEQKMIRLSL